MRPAQTTKQTQVGAAVLLLLLSLFVLPTGGKCFESNGHLCETCPDTPCPPRYLAPLPASSALPASPHYTPSTGIEDSDCYFLTFDRTAHPSPPDTKPFATVIAYLPPPPFVHESLTFVASPPLLPPANAPPPRRRTTRNRSPRAPPPLS